MVTYIDAVRFDRPAPRRMPRSVREAREAALGAAGFGILYPVVLGMTVGGAAAWGGALQFAPGVLLGAVALGFDRGDPRLRHAALLLAVLQFAVGLRVSGVSGLGVVAPVTVCYAWGIAAAVCYLLCRPEAKEWFGAA
ncbi:hypothetical protein [Nocardia arizonensis]|uniref:hypothetical protein n=1 Tax=Nocardia arizonensis TaxID=1141647 RepID=UPI0006D0986D|nr:hypothetical protein [Nocardia arizonensis]